MDKNHNLIHSVQGLPPRVNDGIEFEEYGGLKGELREQGISSSYLGETNLMTLDGLVQDIDDHPLSPEIQKRSGFFASFGCLPVCSYEDKILVAVKEDLDHPERQATNMALDLQENYRHIRLDPNKVSYVILSPEQFEELAPIVNDPTKRREYLNEITDETAAENVFFSSLNRGVRFLATDMHVEPLFNGNRIRYRIDGVLHEFVYNLPNQVFVHLVSMFKERANVPNLSEKLAPQDGSITLSQDFLDKSEAYFERNPRAARIFERYNFRVSTLPTSDGEKVAVRILNIEPESFSFEKLNFSQYIIDGLGSITERPQGLFLVTGPTGSGKTTTLYCMLQTLNNPGTNITTIEDPPEKRLPGVIQTAVNRKKGYTFSTCMPFILRQDPDVILIGEIRDRETAEAAFSAAGTGHQVFSTMHTNNSVASVVRLLDLGIDRFHIQSNLSGSFAQRLCSRLCPNCREEEEDITDRLNSYMKGNVVKRKLKSYTPVIGESCSVCQGTGYHGRIAATELWILHEEEREMILTGVKKEREYYDAAIRNGMIPLIGSGLELVLNGVTSLDELLKTTVSKDDFFDRKEFVQKFLEARQ